MAQLLRTDTRWWPVDKLILTYLSFTGVLILAYWSRLPEAAEFFAWHVAGAALLVLAVKKPSRAAWLFRHWYPLPYVASCYKEMAALIPVIRGSNADQWLADLDYSIWGAHPTVWLERIQSAGLTQFLQVAYTLFIPAVLWVAYRLWRSRAYSEFRFYAFLIAAGYLVSYVGYLIVPARGPRFLLHDLQSAPLQGLWGFEAMRTALDRLESAHYDCFPSGHTELTMLACWGSRMISERMFRAYVLYTVAIVFATVYLRYHYTVDVAAGVATAALLIAAAPYVYRKLS